MKSILKLAVHGRAHARRGRHGMSKQSQAKEIKIAHVYDKTGALGKGPTPSRRRSA